MAWLYLLLSVIGLVLTWNAFRPRYAPASVAIVSFFFGWLIAELPLHVVIGQVLVTLGFAAAGALSTWLGKLALSLSGASWFFLLVCWRRAGETRAVVEAGLREGLGDDYEERILPALRARLGSAIDWRHLALPFPVRHRDVERVRDIIFFRVGRIRLRLDVHRRREPDGAHPTTRPALVFVHGGAWVLGNKNHHGLPLMQLLAARGWVCFGVSYRLSPRATFPDHLIDVKRAIAWVRDHAAEYGVDPGFILVSGGSAGGHLAALAALTAGRAEYQPGFENADTSVAGCIAFYGVYDFADRHGHWPNPGLHRLLERHVMKSRKHDEVEAWERASPMAQVHEGAPPFLVAHGDRDSVVPVAEARVFTALLRARSHAPVVYFEVPGAQHAFEVFPSLRAAHVLDGVIRYVAWLHSRRVEARGAAAPAAAVE